MTTLREMTDNINAALRVETAQESALRVAKHQASAMDFMMASLFKPPVKDADHDAR